MKTKFVLSAIILTLACTSCYNKSENMENELKAFIAKYDSMIIPLSKEVALASWNASISGKDSDFKIAENLEKKYVHILSNHEDYKKLEAFKKSDAIKDTLLSRELIVIYNNYLQNQADTTLLKEIIEMSTNIEKKYNNFRAEIDGKKLSDNEIEGVLKSSADNKKLEAAWKAHKNIGPLVATDIIALVKKRNQVAKELGFNNFQEMSMKTNEQDPAEIEALFDELDSLTRQSFEKVKAEIDKFLAHRDNISIEQLMPWNYQNRFFQEAPKIYTVDLDKYYKNQNLEKLTSDYYSGLDLPLNDLLAKSDLYEKPGKNQHAFCTDIDNLGDVRVLCNIKPNEYWMNTMLHEFGHGVYFKYINRDLPFVLRQPAHTFTTEAIAMMFGRLSSNPQWIQDLTGISDKEKDQIASDCNKSLRLQQLVFSRWSQVMYRFEKSLYENPDQDLNALWWKLVEKYQMIKKPAGRNEPDWATKIHIATVPCYYHNYLLGDLLASQLNYYICDSILKEKVNYNMVSYYKKPEVGNYLKKFVFAPGMKYFWNDMIKRATGEKLTAKYYAKQFVE
jgi:peptidyl-dipeptidase A